jgi:hypothetical protein
MINSQACKVVEVLEPTAVAASTTTDAEFDTAGFENAIIIMSFGAMQDALTTCSITEGDTSGSADTAIPALTVGNAACVDVEGSAITLAMTNDSDCIVFHLDLRKRARFLAFNSVTVSGGSSAHSVHALLFNGDTVDMSTNAGAALASTGTAKVSVV